MADIATVNVTLGAPATNTVVTMTGPQGTPGVFQSILGTTHQVNVAISGSGGSVATLSTPQSIDTTSSPTFAALTITGTASANLFSGSGASLTSIPNTALVHSSLTVTAGTGLSGGGSVALGSSVTLSNAGVLSLAGTNNEIAVSASTGAITLSMPQNVIIPTPSSGTALTVNGGNYSGGLGVTIAGGYTGSGNTSLLTLTDTGNGNGVNIKMTGNGGTTPTKYIRVQAGALHILNDAYTSQLFALTDAGAITTNSTASTALALNVAGTSAQAFLGAPSTYSSTWFIAGNGVGSGGSLLVQHDSSSNAYIRNQASGGSLSLGTGSTNYVVINSSGNTTHYAPSSNTALTVNGAGGAASTSVATIIATQNSASIELVPSNTAGGWNSLAAAGDQTIVANGGTSGTGVLTLVPWSSTSTGIRISGSTNIITMASGGATTMTLGASGNVVITAPTASANALHVNGSTNASGAYAALVSGASTSGQSLGLCIQAGTTTGDYALSVQNQATSNMLTVNGNGNVGISAPASGTTLNVTGAANGDAINIVGSSTAGESFGLSVVAGTNSSDTSIYVANQANSALFFRIKGDGSGGLGYNGSGTTISYSATGAVTIAAPTSGTALTVTGFANADAISIIGSSTSGQSYGLSIEAGTTSGDTALYVANTSNIPFLQIHGDGHGYIGANATNNLSWTTNGNITIAAPSSGTALTVNGIGTGVGINLVSGSLDLNGSPGTSGQVLTSAGSGALPTWSTLTATTATNIAGGAAGSLVYQTAANTTGFIAAGTNTYVLTMVSGSPAWAANLGGVTSITGTANQITASASTGAVTLSLPATITGLTSVSSTTFVGALTGTASGNLVSGGALGTPSSGTLTNCTFPTLNQNTTGNAATATLASTITTTSSSTNAAYDVAFLNSSSVEYDSSLNYNPSSNTLTAPLVLVGSGATIGGTPPSYGCLSIAGEIGGYAGIEFSGTTNATTGGYTLMISASAAPASTISGIYGQTGTAPGWLWYFEGSTLTAGTVPAANVSAGSFGSGNFAVTGTMSATAFSGPLTGNVTGNCSGSSGSCTGNAATATSATSATSATTASVGTAVTCTSSATASAFAITFANTTTGTTGNYGQLIDSGASLTYNPSTNVFIAPTVDASSDIRLKTNVTRIEDSGNIVDNITGVRFNWAKSGQANAGVIAQDVEAVIPELVHENGDGYKAVNYNGLIGVLIEEVKALRARVAELEGR